MNNEKPIFKKPTWQDLDRINRQIRKDMVEVPEGDVSLGGRVFHVGKFKISKSLVTVSLWNEVMGVDGLASDRPVTGVSFEDFIPFRKCLNRYRQAPGILANPTEEQLELALQTGSISLDGEVGEVCLTRFREYLEMGDDMMDNIPRSLPADFVVKCGGGERLSVRSDRTVPSDGSGRPLGFRLVLSMYNIPKPSDDDFLRVANNLLKRGRNTPGKDE